jgi:hypothetical protein
MMPGPGAFQPLPRVLSCGCVVLYRSPPMIGNKVWCLKHDQAVRVAGVVKEEPT